MLRILLVEDDNDLNSLIATYLKEAGYEVVTTFNGLDALKEFHESKFDLILSDIMMPLCDGYELARQVRVTNNQVPLVFMSARDDKPSKQLGYKTGIDDYITKPFDIEELVELCGPEIETALDKGMGILFLGDLSTSELDEIIDCAD